MSDNNPSSPKKISLVKTADTDVETLAVESSTDSALGEQSMSSSASQAPAEATPASSSASQAPAEATPASSSASQAPAEATPASSSASQAPAEATPASSSASQAPAEATPASSSASQAPAEATPASSSASQAPAEATPATDAPTPEGENKSEAGKRRSGADLSHFGKRARQEFEEADGGADKESISDKINAMFSGLSRKREGGENPAKLKNKALVQTVDFLRRRPKIIVWGIVGVLLVIVAIIILPLVPMQIQRSAGFAAMEQKDYDKAFSDLSAYLNERPNDHEASYKAAQAALYQGDFTYAETIFNRLYRSNALSEPNLPYNFALANVRNPEVALPTLDKLLIASPNHAAGLLLRGLLLSEKADTFRKAREDILRVDEIIRNADSAFEEIIFLHQFLVKTGALLFAFDEALDDNLATALGSESTVLLGFDVGWNGYTNRYQTSDVSVFSNDTLQARTVVLLYLVYGLMRQGELQEAASEIKGASVESPDSPTVKQVSALLAVRQGDHAQASRLFQELADKNPDDIQTKLNLAVALWAATPEKINIDNVVAIYDDVLAKDNSNVLAANNSAFLLLVKGDYQQAGERLNKVATDANLPEVQFNRSLIALWGGDFSQAVESMSAISADKIPAVKRYVAVLQLERGNFSKALLNLWTIYGKNPNDAVVLSVYVETLIKLNMWRIAYNELNNFLDANSGNNDAGLRYYLALSALNLGELEVFERQKALLDAVSAEYAHYHHALQGLENSRNKKLQNEAITAYYKAMQTAPSLKQKQRYAVLWGQLTAEKDPTQVISELTPLMEKRFSPELAAILAYGLSFSDPKIAANLIRFLGDKEIVHLTTVQKYLGAALVRLGKVEQGFVLMEEARQWLPTDERYLVLLEKIQREAGKADIADETKAVIEYLQAIRIGEGPLDNVAYKIALPVVADLAKKIQAAVSDDSPATKQTVLDEYEKVIAQTKSPETIAQLIRSRGTFYSFLKRYQEAGSDFSKAIALGFSDNKELIGALLFYVKTLRQIGDYNEALQVMRRVIEIEGDAPVYLRIQGEIQIDLADHDEAVETFSELLSRYPADIKSYYNISNLAYQSEDIDGAAEWLEILLRVAPNIPSAYKNLAEIYLARGDKWLAEIYLDAYSRLTQ